MAKQVPPKQGVNRWEEELARQAEEAAGQETASSAFLSFKGGRLYYKGVEIEGGKINVVVMASVHENLFYLDRYDSENPTPPVCYAFGENEKGMVPHPDCSEPQSSDCASCKHNVFGSADTGKGKACKNSRRLIMITEDELENVAEAEAAQAKLPVTSVKNWGNFVSMLNTTMKRPPFSMVAELKVIPDDKTQFQVLWKPVGQITDGAILQAIVDRRPAAMEAMMQPYPAPQARPEPPARGTRPAPGKGARPGKY